MDVEAKEERWRRKSVGMDNRFAGRTSLQPLTHPRVVGRAITAIATFVLRPTPAIIRFPPLFSDFSLPRVVPSSDRSLCPDRWLKPTYAPAIRQQFRSSNSNSTRVEVSIFFFYGNPFVPSRFMEKLIIRSIVKF